MKQVAILGGSFDPVHWGHLLLAQTALSQLTLDQVIWVPTRHPPHKQGLAYEHRRLMVEIAIANNPAFMLDRVRTLASTPDYAVITFAELQNTYPHQHWYWILGIDSFRTLPSWYQREKLIPACIWLVAPRPFPMAQAAIAFESDTSLNQRDTPDRLCQQVTEKLASQNIPIHWQLLHMPPLGISSTLIRQYCRQRRSIRYLVPEDVQAYITTHNLYADE